MVVVWNGNRVDQEATLRVIVVFFPAPLHQGDAVNAVAAAVDRVVSSVGPEEGIRRAGTLRVNACGGRCCTIMQPKPGYTVGAGGQGYQHMQRN
jgi:hypothetical protein